MFRLRAIALGVVTAAALTGVATRLERRSAGFLEPVAFDAQSLDMSPGDVIGNAVFDGVVKKPLWGLRLRLAKCGDPAFVIPIPILSVAAPQLIERIYGLPAYRSTDVYRGHIRDGFSHVSRLMSYITARATVLWSNEQTIDGWYVRAYVPSDCLVSSDAYVEWAAALLKLGRKGARMGEVSNTPVTSQ